MAGPAENPSSADDNLETSIDEAIALCGGDMRATIRALIVGNGYLEGEIERLMEAVSGGYVRRDIRR